LCDELAGDATRRDGLARILAGPVLSELAGARMRPPRNLISTSQELNDGRSSVPDAAAQIDRVAYEVSRWAALHGARHTRKPS
jgi:hypothetical protein